MHGCEGERMEDIEDTNYKFNSQDIENIWYIFFCLADSTFSSVDVSYGKNGPYMVSGETMMSICKVLLLFYIWRCAGRLCRMKNEL